MYYCPVCGSILEFMPCADCGFDLSRCAELYPTLTAQAVSAPVLRASRNTLYEALRRAKLDLEERLKQVQAMEEKLIVQERELQTLRIRFGGLFAEAGTGALEGGSSIPIPGVENQRKGSSNTGMLYRFADTKDSAQEIKTWECECGCRNPVGRRFCVNCGNAENRAEKTAPIRTQVTRAAENNKKWECNCGCRNPMVIPYCKNCGSTRSD